MNTGIAMRNFSWLLAALLTGCGFELRDEVALPPALDRLRIDSPDPYGPLERDLTAALKRAGAVVVDDAAGVAVVRIPVDAIATEPLSVSDAARVREYLVRYRVELEIVDAANRVLIPLAPIELTRDYSYDETQALGAAAEEELLRKELRREMVQQLLRRIETARAPSP
ncbi:MAG TPA: LPS assembly lipoprotein LptE [Candidatus Saccharimonadia bacterium]|nr:LPS assembly lipoprotein LptE [Candidatus Saccharimonadia bacterium]